MGSDERAANIYTFQSLSIEIKARYPQNSKPLISFKLDASHHYAVFVKQFMMCMVRLI
jgi:hypothetical protein